MQAEMPISNRPKDSARIRRARTLRVSLGLTFMLVFCLSWARAQSNSTAKQSPIEAAGSAASASGAQTRSRRVVEATDEPAGSALRSDASESPDDSAPMTANGQERLDMLRAQIESAKTDAERSRLQRVLIDYLVALGKKSEAVAELRVMSRAERLDPIGFYNIGNQLARLGDTDTAIDAYRKAISQRHGNYARALNNMGVMFLRQGRWDEAAEAFASALRLEDFRYGEASYNLGRVYSARGEADMAIREWGRALAVEPSHADAAIALARAYAEDGSPERGLLVLDSFVARRGPSTEMAAARREILFGGGDAAGASLNASSKASGNAPVKGASINTPAAGAKANAGGRNSAGDKSTGGKRAAVALRSLMVDQETYDLLQRARAAREGGRPEEAARFYQRVLTRERGFFPPANLELGFVLNELKRHEEAAETLAAVARREGARYPIAYFYLGRQYELLGRLNLAAEAFEQASAAYGDANPQFLLDLSRVRDKEGNARAALEAMENFVRISQSLGRVPEWSAARLAELREKANKK
jgi:tetratricopeptide (TPR) repeat protein